MNWKNITLEDGFIKQEISFDGSKVVNYIPLDKVDSFGVSSTENKNWLYAGCFFALCSLVCLFAGETTPMLTLGAVAAGLFFQYFSTRQTWFKITSNQTKFSVQIKTTKEEIEAVREFVTQIKNRIHLKEAQSFHKAA